MITLITIFDNPFIFGMSSLILGSLCLLYAVYDDKNKTNTSAASFKLYIGGIGLAIIGVYKLTNYFI